MRHHIESAPLYNGNGGGGSGRAVAAQQAKLRGGSNLT